MRNCMVLVSRAWSAGQINVCYLLLLGREVIMLDIIPFPFRASYVTLQADRVQDLGCALNI